jgi:hypothetical protein
VPPEPDRFIYRIRCPPREVTLAERQLVGPWRELVDRVQETTEPERARPRSGSDGGQRPGSTRPGRNA